jgi:hypothetical protein
MRWKLGINFDIFLLRQNDNFWRNSYGFNFSKLIFTNLCNHSLTRSVNQSISLFHLCEKYTRFLFDRVARCYIFKPKISIWVKFGGPWNRKGWYVLRPFGILDGQLVYFMAIYFMAIWYIWWPIGIFYGQLVHIFYGHLVYLMVIWYILWPFGIFDGHLVYLMVIWYILWPFGIFWWPFGIFDGHLVI